MKEKYTVKLYEGGTFRQEIKGLLYGEAIALAESSATLGNSFTVKVLSDKGKEIAHYGHYLTEEDRSESSAF